MVSSVASKVTMPPSRTRLMRDRSIRASSTSPLRSALGLHLQQSTRRTKARLDLTQALECVLELGQSLPQIVRLYIAKPDVQIAHVLPKTRDLGLQIRDLSLDQRLLDLLIEQHFLAQKAFAEQALQVGKTAIHDGQMLILLGNLIGHGVGLGFNTRPLALQGFDLLTIHFCQPGKGIVLGGVSEIEVHVAAAQANKHRHDKIFVVHRVVLRGAPCA